MNSQLNENETEELFAAEENQSWFHEPRLRSKEATLSQLSKKLEKENS